ncbi:hypothetical protein PMAYCL1PPCAC_32519 [Pristionchus mayeri]|uniref:Uncharacterized protein n=1 Tax=Pristionchus mayeri TaxID=1317129 RepID=A0AAN5IF22_9BILA|nr:hypothetical protein PMAYCL1PPCAC_32519 [Pristionchus mayeri]
MAERPGAAMESGYSCEFRGRMHSFSTVGSILKKKRPAALPLDFSQPQRPRLDELNLSVSAPVPSSPLVRALEDFASARTTEIPAESESQDDSSNGLGSSEFSIIPSDLTSAASPELVTPPGSMEDDEEELRHSRIVRPEDISLHNPDSGLGYRATDYFTEDEDEDESEQEEGEVTEPDDFFSSQPEYPDNEREMFLPRSRSLGDLVDQTMLGEDDVSLPYTTPLELNVMFDPTVHMGLLMIDPSHQNRFNELYLPPDIKESPHTSFTSYDSLLAQYEASNALTLNTDLDDEEILEEIVEVIEDDDYHPVNPPSSPAFLHSE